MTKIEFVLVRFLPRTDYTEQEKCRDHRDSTLAEIIIFTDGIFQLINPSVLGKQLIKVT